MQKVISLFRKLVGSEEIVQTRVSLPDAQDTSPDVGEVLAQAEAIAIDILVQPADKRIINQFVYIRNEFARLIKETKLETLYKVMTARAFESFIAPIHKDLPYTEADLLVKSSEEDSALLRKLFLSMLCLQPYEAREDLLFNRELQEQLLQKPALLRPYIKYIFGSFYNYVYVGESAKHAAFYKKALENILALFNRCSEDERLHLATNFIQAYPGYIPICTEDSLKEHMVIFRQLSKLILDEQKSDNGLVPLSRSANTERKIRLGHLRHNFAGEINYLLAPMSKLDKNKFEITVFAFDSVGLEQARNAYPDLCYQVLDMQDIRASINRIREADIDILINGTPLNGSGFEPHARLLLKRVAKIQCLWTADFVTSGMQSIDYWLLGDAYRHLNLEEQIIEEPHYLPGVGYYVPCQVYDESNAIDVRKELSLKADEIVYLSTANIIKLSPELLSVWLRIIKTVDKSRLILAPYAVPSFMKKMRRRLEKSLDELCAEIGVSRERVSVSEINGSLALRKLIDASDIYLDSFPYAGPTSTTEPLMVNKPVVVLGDKTYRADATAGILRSIGLETLIARNWQDYIAKAVSFGQSQELREKVSNEIKEAMVHAVYLDSSKVALHLEEALLNLVENKGEA